MKQIHTHSKRHILFLLQLSLLLSLIALRYAFQIDVPRPVFLILIVGICLFGDQDEILAMYMCCVPMHESIDFFYALVFCTIFYVFKFWKRIRLNLVVILVLVMILWELLHCLGYDFSIIGFLTNIIPLVVLVIVVCSDLSDMDYPFIIRAASLATACICLTLLLRVFYRAGFNVTLALAGLQRLGVETSEINQNSGISNAINPNTLGIICVLAATGLLQLQTAKRGTKLDLVIASTIIVFGALTASRTYLVCLASMLLLFLLGHRSSPAQKLKFLCAIILVLCVALVVLYTFFPDLMLYYIGRFFVKDITTGRSDLMISYHDYIISNPRVLLFGIGLQDFSERLIQTLRVAENAPHNAIQEMVIAWGLPGLMLFAALLLSITDLSKYVCRHQRLINYIPLLIILLKSQAGQLLNSPYSMLTLSYAYLSLCFDLSSKPNDRISPCTAPNQRGYGRNINQTRRKSIK